MSRVGWGSDANRLAIFGVDQVTLFDPNGSPTPWDGVISITDNPSSTPIATQYVDGRAVSSNKITGETVLSIKAYTYPDVLDSHEIDNLFSGGLRRRSMALSYRTGLYGSNGDLIGHRLHIVYNATLKDDSVNYVGSSKDATPMSFGWTVTAKPVPVANLKATAHFFMDFSLAYSGVESDLYDALYGTEDSDGFLLSPDDLISFFEERAALIVLDHGDGTWSAIGSDDIVRMLDSETFQIDWSSANYISSDAYVVSTY